MLKVKEDGGGYHIEVQHCIRYEIVQFCERVNF